MFSFDAQLLALLIAAATATALFVITLRAVKVPAVRVVRVVVPKAPTRVKRS